jgi:kynurenine 3-monooxygenase
LLKRSTINAGRSINLALSVRGFAALEEIGLKEALLNISIPMYGRMVHDV